MIQQLICLLVGHAPRWVFREWIPTPGGYTVGPYYINDEYIAGTDTVCERCGAIQDANFEWDKRPRNG